MKITSISSVLLQPPQGTPWVLVKVRTDEGITGIGESYHGAGVHQIAVDERLGRRLIGADPRNVDKLFRDMMRSMSASGFYQGAVMSAISGIEMALWDVTGQAVGAPIWQLLGGKFRDRIRLYASLNEPEHTADAWLARSREAETLGFDQVKMGVEYVPELRRDMYNRSLSRGEIAHNIEVMTVLRENLKPTTDIAFDAHWAYAPADIIKLARAVEPLDLVWLEDPIPPENVAVMAQLKASTTTPITTGEHYYTRHGFRDLIEKQGVDIISPDFAKAGGLSEGKRIADLANLYYINVAPHHVGSSIQTMAVCHLCATIPNFFAFEYHHPQPSLWDDMIVESPIIEDGYVTVPDRPGLGVTLNEKAVAEYAVDNLGFFD